MRRLPLAATVVCAAAITAYAAGQGGDPEPVAAVAEPPRQLEVVANRTALESPERVLAVRRTAAAESETRWQLPLAKGSYRISTRFGDPRARGARGRHSGTDFAIAEGTPVGAAAAGTVVAAGWGGGYGNLVKVQHDGGVQTWYAHLSAFSVAAGERVQPGQRVGRVGDTGRSFGPHLHFEVRLAGVPVDPATFLAARDSAP